MGVKQVGPLATTPTEAVTKAELDLRGLNIVVLGVDVANSNATANVMADVTGLSFAVVAGGTYYFRFLISYTAALATTGSRWSLGGPAFTALRYRSEYSLTATTQTLNEGVAGYDLPAASNLSSASVGSNIALVEGFIVPSAAGVLTARFASEVLSSAITAKAGSVVEWRRVL